MIQELSAAEMIAQRAVIEIFRMENVKVVFSKRTFDLTRRIKDIEFLTIWLYGITTGINQIELKEDSSILGSRELKEVVTRNPGPLSLNYIVVSNGINIKAHFLSKKQLKIIEDNF